MQPRYEIVVGDSATDLFGKLTLDPGSVFLAEGNAFFEGAPVGKPATCAAEIERVELARSSASINGRSARILLTETTILDHPFHAGA